MGDWISAVRLWGDRGQWCYKWVLLRQCHGHQHVDMCHDPQYQQSNLPLPWSLLIASYCWQRSPLVMIRYKSGHPKECSKPSPQTTLLANGGRLIWSHQQPANIIHNKHTSNVHTRKLCKEPQQFSQQPMSWKLLFFKSILSHGLFVLTNCMTA